MSKNKEITAREWYDAWAKGEIAGNEIGLPGRVRS